MKGLSLALIGSLAAVICGCASHAALTSRLDAYSPPPFFEHNLRPEPVTQASIPGAVAADPQMEAQLARLGELKSQWRQALSARDVLPPVYDPEARLWARLAPLATGEEKLRAFIAQGFSLAELEILTLLRHPGVQAAQKTLSASLEGFDQVTQLDEILRQYAAFTEGVMPGVGPMKGSDPIRMKFPYPGIAALKGQVANQEVKIAWENLALARRDALREARRAYWDLSYVIQAQGITRETLSLLAHLEAVATTRYEAGSTSYQDVVKVRIERALLGERLQSLVQGRRGVAAEIRALLELAPQVPLGNPRGRPPALSVPPLEALFALAREQRQELRRLRARIGKAQRMIEMAETMILPAYGSDLSLYPDLAVRQVGRAAPAEPFGTTLRAETGAGLPKLPWYGSQDAYLREIRQKLQALQADLRRAETATDARVRQGWINLDEAQREVLLYRSTIVELSQTSLDISTRGYEAGKVAFADVISSYSQWLNTRLTLFRKRSELGIAWADLEQVTGGAWRPTGIADK